MTVIQLLGVLSDDVQVGLTKDVNGAPKSIGVFESPLVLLADMSLDLGVEVDYMEVLAKDCVAIHVKEDVLKN